MTGNIICEFIHLASILSKQKVILHRHCQQRLLADRAICFAQSSIIHNFQLGHVRVLDQHPFSYARAPEYLYRISLRLNILSWIHLSQVRLPKWNFLNLSNRTLYPSISWFHAYNDGVAPVRNFVSACEACKLDSPSVKKTGFFQCCEREVRWCISRKPSVPGASQALFFPARIWI